MRTTITFDDDVAAVVIQEQRRNGAGVSAVVNELIRKGLVGSKPAQPFVQATSDMQGRIDVTNVAEALEVLDGPGAP
jgi:SOS response regulatory protein OraA/RecX